jgi:hypothetical protein
MARQGKMARDARTQGIGMPSSSACRQGIIGIGMPSASSSAIAIDIIIGNCHRHRHHRQGIGIIGIGMPSSASSSASAAAGRRTAGRSKVAQYSHTDFERVLRCAVVKIFE